MGNYFTVGEKYQNRIGEYEVVEVTTPTLKIRYVENGRMQDVEEELQERIVRNLLRETEQSEHPQPTKKKATRPRPTRRKRAKFDGFTQADFQGQVTGTSWRAKTGLGGVITNVLGERLGEAFDSWAPNRETSCYITAPEHASQEHLHDSAQFFVNANPAGLGFGLCVQRPAEADEGSSAWDRLISALADDDTTSERLNDLLTGGVVELSWYGETWGSAERETVRGGEEEGLISDRGAVTEEDTIHELIERLNEAPQDQSMVLTIEASMTPAEAVAAGPGVAHAVVDVLEKLVDLYRACSE